MRDPVPIQHPGILDLLRRDPSRSHAKDSR